MSSGAGQQDDLERILAASRELRARYRNASSEEPAALIDDAIRAQARRAVGSRPRRPGSSFSANWRVPLSIAAVMVLSVSLTVMTVRHDKHQPSADQLPERQSVPAAEPQAVTPPPAAASAPPRSQAKARTEEKQNAPALKDESRAATAPAVGGSAHLERDFAKTPAAPPKPDEPLAQARKKEAAPFPAAPVIAAPSAQNAPPPPEAPSETTAVRGLQAQPEQESTAVRSTEALAKRGRASEQPDDAPKASSPNPLEAQGYLREDNTLTRAERAAPAAKPQAAPAPSDAAERPRTAPADAVASWESDPKEWLRHIELLVRQQRMSEAREGLKAFRQRYPSYPLPPEFPLQEP